MADIRDNYGMIERSEDDWVMRTQMADNDPEIQAMHTKLDAIKTVLDAVLTKLTAGIKTQVVPSL